MNKGKKRRAREEEQWREGVRYRVNVVEEERRPFVLIDRHSTVTSTN